MHIIVIVRSIVQKCFFITDVFLPDPDVRRVNLSLEGRFIQVSFYVGKCQNVKHDPGTVCDATR